MAIFPKNPSIDDQISIGAILYAWNGVAWEVYTKPTPRQTYFESSSPPPSPQDGDKWKDVSTEKIFDYLSEENVWIENA